jgi:hypothetical protein
MYWKRSVVLVGYKFGRRRFMSGNWHEEREQL